ncbi:hypothetical protein K461DRAFT_282833 [Myriangium duriaei CBS 260.36]|uniref:Uncharacterized protein n=1 Tax=Myriangium duriaei CBS 260.36 TaxID=1168546 RepID=A0A9P4MFX7_9PEZI|nr:hypothetical protein K461DRAFT_282833 [Myriangium duriaei CBS 260.36]
MPHKHTLGKTSRSDEDFDLAPTQRAAPLSVHGAPIFSKPSKKRKRPGSGDDTPAAFKRLMAQQAYMKSRSQPSKSTDTRDSISTSERNTKSSKSSKATRPSDTTEEPVPTKASGNTDPSLLLPRAPNSDITALKNKSTRLQRKIERKVSAWRTEDARLRQKAVDDAAAAREAEEERIATALERNGISAGMMDDEEFLKDVGLGWEEEKKGAGKEARKEERQGEGEKKVKGGRKRGRKEEDDWAVLKEKRGQRARLGDVVQAPPELKRVREVFKVRGKDDTGKKKVMDEEGLKRKAELGEARLEVIKRYREMMGRKGGL